MLSHQLRFSGRSSGEILSELVDVVQVHAAYETARLEMRSQLEVSASPSMSCTTIAREFS